MKIQGNGDGSLCFPVKVKGWQGSKTRSTVAEIGRRSVSEAATSEHTEAAGIQKAASTHFPKTKSSVVGLEEVVRKGAGRAEPKREQLERAG